MAEQTDPAADAPNSLFLFSNEHSFRAMGHVPTAQEGDPVDTPTVDWLAAQVDNRKW